jgi:hypothetical protein
MTLPASPTLQYKYSPYYHFSTITHIVPIFVRNSFVDGIRFVNDKIGIRPEGKVGIQLGSQMQRIGGSFVHLAGWLV